MTEVHIFWQKLTHYRLPVLQRFAVNKKLILHLAEPCDFNRDCLNFDIVYSKQYTALGFTFFPVVFKLLFKRKAVLVFEANLRRLDAIMCILFNLRVIYWGIGVSGSYSRKFNMDDWKQSIRGFIFSKAKSVVCYSEIARDSYLRKYPALSNNFFAANNTIIVDHEFRSKFEGVQKENILLFIGTLYKEKGIFDILDAYFESNLKVPFYIVGDGDGFEALVNVIEEMGMQDYVITLGRLDLHNGLADLLSRAPFVLQPYQAGLTIQTAASFGCLSLVLTDCITGGEVQDLDKLDFGFSFDKIGEMFQFISSEFKQGFSVNFANARDNYWRYRNGDQLLDVLDKAVLNALRF